MTEEKNAGVIEGLVSRDIPALQQRYGKNIFESHQTRRFLHIFLDILKEPMLILLLVACSLYFVTGSFSEGFTMLAAICIVAAISLYQEARSNNAIKALQQYTEPMTKAIRDGRETVVATADLVPGDILLLSEGMTIPADATLVRQNDFTVNESIITGESMPADKNEQAGHNLLYQGTSVNSGKCTARVTATGNKTILGISGSKLGRYTSPVTALQVQLNRFVRRFAWAGFIAFALIFLANYRQQPDWTSSLLFALTIAMSMIPEEIPVAFSSFMALGTYKLSKLGVIARQPQIVENLGAVSVLCLDKTGTITENRMQVKTIYDYSTDELIELDVKTSHQQSDVLWYGMLASEVNPFDAMEKAILEAFQQNKSDYEPAQLKMVYEYPLEGQPPMMTHLYDDENKLVAAAKGAAERIIRVCRLSEKERIRISAIVQQLAAKGWRVLGVAGARPAAVPYPLSQDDFNWQFKGLLALYDPPKANIQDILKKLYAAKIDIKMITGDYHETAISIAGQAGFFNHLKYVTGGQVANMKEAELCQVVKNTNIFTRMFPEAKLKVIEALKKNGEIVAMTGDGVNDGLALKTAHIGIAMGKRGTEIAKQASDLVLTDDNLQHIVTAVSEGRKIFTNLKKAIRYILSIHIPIILTASVPVLSGWKYPNIFSPVHIIFLELIMGPTCSIFFEKEPAEADIMRQQPRKSDTGLFTKDELLLSIVQGLVITAGVLILYYYFMNGGATIEKTRTIVFTTIILSNIFLTFANRSFTQPIYQTSRSKNPFAPIILIISALFLTVILLVPPARNLFQLDVITTVQCWLCLGVAFVSVMWVEVYKTDLSRLRS